MSSTPTGIRDHRDAIGKGARLGYLARAAVFMTIGTFAFRTAFAGGNTLSEEEAISRIVGSPFGGVMLVLLVIALPCFALCRFGLVARGLVFAAIAVLFFTDASRWTPDHTPGLEDALGEIGSWPYGRAILSATGLGLVAFGLYALLPARYGHIRSPDLDPSEAIRKARAAA